MSGLPRAWRNAAARADAEIALSVTAGGARLGCLWPARADLRKRRALDVAVDARDQIIGEKDANVPASRTLQATGFQIVVIVPARIVKGSRNHRRAEQVAHLAVGHAGFDLRYHHRVEIVALLNRHPVDAAARGDGCRH